MWSPIGMVKKLYLTHARYVLINVNWWPDVFSPSATAVNRWNPPEVTTYSCWNFAQVMRKCSLCFRNYMRNMHKTLKWQRLCDDGFEESFRSSYLKFKIAPAKNGCWKIRLSYWVSVTFQGFLLLNWVKVDGWTSENRQIEPRTRCEWQPSLSSTC